MENKNNTFLGKIEKAGCYVNNGKYGYFLTCGKKNYKIPEFLLTKLVEYVKDIFLMIGNYLYPSKVNSFMEQQIYLTPDVQFSKYKNPN